MIDFWHRRLVRSWLRRRRLLPPTPPLRGEGYMVRALDLSPVAFWPLDETSGTVAANMEGTASRNGVYANVTLGAPGLFDDSHAVSCSGTSGFVSIAGAASALNGAEGSFSLWFKPYARSLWSDGVTRRLLTIAVDANNYVIFHRNGAIADLLQVEYKAGGVSKLFNTVAFGERACWSHITLTWSKSNDRVRLYLDGVQIMTDLTGLGNWSGVPLIMALGSVPPTSQNPWKGELAMAGLWDRELEAEEVLTLSRRTYERPASGDVLTVRYFGMGGCPCFSADGSYIYYDRIDASGGNQIYRQPTAGGPEVCLTNPAPAGAPAVELHKGWTVLHPSADWAITQVEIPGHPLEKGYALPVRGLYNDLWRFKPSTNSGWTNLTNYGTAGPVTGVLNPHFSQDGSKLYWVERITGVSHRYRWGIWRICVADFDAETGALDYEGRSTYMPHGFGWYDVMGEFAPGIILFATDRGGLRPYTPDLALFNTATGATLLFTDSDGQWDEHAYTRDGVITYSSSKDYPDVDKLAIAYGDYTSLMGDIYLRDSQREIRLTHLNDDNYPGSGEEPAFPCAQGISPDGSMVVFTRHLHGESYGGPQWRRVFIVHRQA